MASSTPCGQLLGQETELAVRFVPKGYSEHPGNKVIFDYLSRAVRTIVKTKPGKRNFIQDQFFVQNGGAIYYEHHPQDLKKGLIECATPECHSSHELVLYQRAHEELLNKAIPIAKKFMAREGIEGELSLIKNCCDYEGNTYGSQENYDSHLASGFSYFLMTSLLIAYIPLALVLKVIYLVCLIPFILFIFASKVLLEILSLMGSRRILSSIRDKVFEIGFIKKICEASLGHLNFEPDDSEEFLLKIEYTVFYPLFWLSYKPLIIIYNRFAFRDLQDQIHAHIVSRIIYTGAGSLLKDGRFIFSEKSQAINNYRRASIHRKDKPLFDCGNLIKEYELAIWELFLLRGSAWRQLLRKSQRLQIAFSDSNRAHIAEFLKVGVTSLLVKMANENYLRDAPRLKSPVSALQTITKDIGLNEKVLLTEEERMTALEIQEWYLAKAKEFLKEKTVAIENHEIVRIWEEVLHALKQNPEKLIGRIDWVTKKYLLQTGNDDFDYWNLKKIDLKYHELGTGYFDILQKEKMTLDLFTDSDVEKAIYEPSSPDRVKLRSRLISSIAFENKPVVISWRQARIGRWKPKVISLANYKQEGGDPPNLGY